MKRPVRRLGLRRTSRNVMRPAALLILSAVVWAYGHGAATPQAARPDGAPPEARYPDPDPEGGAVTNGAYQSEYFALAYQVPPDWKEGLGGPPPSAGGYYVLSALVTKDEVSGSILIAAQDMFFAAKPLESAMAMVKDARQAMATVAGMRIDRGPAEVTIAGHGFGRLDYSGVGLYHALLATSIRCHVLSFVITANDPALLQKAILSLDRMSLPAEASAGTSGSALPACVKNYATAPNILRKVEPRPVGPNFVPIPVRIIVGADGRVAHIHVINALQEQKKSIEDAVRQWEFKPYQSGGRAVPVETGLVFEFKPAAR